MTEHDLGRLAAFVENRLDADERRAVMAHLADCKDCRTVVAGLARGSAGAAGSGVERTWTRPAVWLPVAAAAVIVIGVSWAILDRTDRLIPTSPDPAAVSPGGATTTPTPGAAPTGPPVQTPAPRPTQPADPGVTRRAGEREIAGRRFRLEAGTWIDVAYDPFALLPAVDVRTAAERDALVARLPAFKPFLALGPKFTVVHDGTVYRFDLPR